MEGSNGAMVEIFRIGGNTKLVEMYSTRQLVLLAGTLMGSLGFPLTAKLFC